MGKGLILRVKDVMQLKIYFGEKPVYLCDELDEKLKEKIHHPEIVYIDELSSPAINSLLHEIKRDEINGAIIIDNDFVKLKKSFFKHFKLIEAGGGIVQNKSKELLFIFRRGRWDLPKGKLEKGESPELCAERETKEETGLSSLDLKRRIGETYHVYDEFGKHYLKLSHWYYFTCDDGQKLKPQTEEDILEAKWIPTKEIKKPLSNTYATIKDILSEFFDTP